MTRYLVLRRTGSHEDANWAPMNSVEARSHAEAIRKAVAPKEEQPAATGEFVAVPARSWKPVTVKVETQTKVTFS